MSRRLKKFSVIESAGGLRLRVAGAFLPALALMLLLHACNKADDGKPSAEKAHIFTNIVYGERERHSLDLYLPVNRSCATPLVVLVHGGGWCTGAKENAFLQSECLKNRGYAVAAINYRYIGGQEKLTVSAQLEDIGRALDFLRQHSSYYTYSLDRVGMLGFSAGAHLALLFSYTAATGRVGAVAGFAAATDLTPTNYISGAPDFFAILTGRPFLPEYYNVYRDASPLWKATPASPPTLLFHGLLDQTIACDHSLHLSVRLDSLGVSNQVNILSGSGHAFEGEDMEALMQQCVSWFETKL